MSSLKQYAVCRQKDSSTEYLVRFNGISPPLCTTDINAAKLYVVHALAEEAAEKLGEKSKGYLTAVVEVGILDVPQMTRPDAGTSDISEDVTPENGWIMRYTYKDRAFWFKFFEASGKLAAAITSKDGKRTYEASYHYEEVCAVFYNWACNTTMEGMRQYEQQQQQKLPAVR